MNDDTKQSELLEGPEALRSPIPAATSEGVETPPPPANLPATTAGNVTPDSSGLDPVAFGDALALRAMNRDQLLDWVKDNLKLGTDYGIVKDGGKPSLWQPGAQKICGMLSLRPFFPDVEKYVDRCVAGQAIDEVLIRCYLYDAYGNCVAQGTGARGAIREKGDYKDGKRTGTTEYRDLNFAIKMSQKSAHIDATNRASGLSAIFTQDHPDEAQDLTPIKGTPEEGYLLQLAGELFGIDEASGVLESLALRRFRIKDGDWTQIPAYRLSYAVKSLRDKAKSDGIGEPA